MQLTAAIINAGLGDLTLGIKMAGFNVVASYDEEEKAVNIHRRNFDSPMHQLSLEKIDVQSFPDVDLLAAHIYCPYLSSRSKVISRKDIDYSFDILSEILKLKRPRAFLLILNTTLIKNEQFHSFLPEVVGFEYHFLWELLDVAKMTGFPVKEKMACVIGVSKALERAFEFPSQNSLSPEPLSVFLERKEFIDPWYYRINLHNTPVFEEGQPFFLLEKRCLLGY